MEPERCLMCGEIIPEGQQLCSEDSGQIGKEKEQ